MDYMVSLVAAAMSTTTVPENESLHLVALNLYPHVVLQRNLLRIYKRPGKDYLQLESRCTTQHGHLHYTYSDNHRMHLQLLGQHAHTTFLRASCGGYYYNQWGALR